MDQSNERKVPVGSDRRVFLQQAAMWCAGVAMSGTIHAADATAPPDSSSASIPRRPLGKTGLQVSILGLSGYSLGQAPSPARAQEMVRQAIDAGVNLFETAWEYEQGASEQWLGAALQGRREKVVVIGQVCTHGRGQSVGMQQLDESLKRLQTDHLDVWLIHEVNYWNEPDLCFAKGGVIEALDAAKQQGKARFTGFSGFRDPGLHLKMLSHDYPFDAVAMPLNPFDATYRSFQKQVLPELQKRQIAVLGMMSLSGDASPVYQGALSAEEGMRYAMSLPVASTLSGIETPAILQQDLSVARGFEPMSARQMQQLVERCAPLAADGHLELYKSTMKFAGPVGREQHGFPPREELPL